jgi:CheY-like chemotaxis protein
VNEAKQRLTPTGPIRPARPTVDADGDALPDAHEAPGVGGSVPALRILIIEDNQDAAETLGDLLTLFGHQAEIAHSGAGGVDLARRRRPDLVLCDIGLPGMDGYAVARELRADPRTAPIRLIALTGYGREADRDRAANAGFDLHLVKPVGPEMLRSLLEDFAEGGARLAGAGDLQPQRQ